MRGKQALLLSISLIGLFLIIPINTLLGQPTDKPADTGQPPQQPAEVKSPTAVEAPKTFEQAQALFNEAFSLTIEEKFDEAIARYKVLHRYFSEEKGDDYKRYTISVLNNLGIILIQKGELSDGRRELERAYKYATELKDWDTVSDIHYKLGFVYSHMAKEDEAIEKMAGVISATPIKLPPPKIYSGYYTQLNQGIGMQSIVMKGMENPFALKAEDFTKLFLIKLKDEFDPNNLILPDTITCGFKINKSGYSAEDFSFPLAPNISLAKVERRLISKPRRIKATIFEDFFKREVAPEEITLTQKIGGKMTGKPVTITEKQTFKPGFYQLMIRKSGYEQIMEDFILYPSELVFDMKRTLTSKVRLFIYRIEGDYIEAEVIPDEITLNGQPVTKDCKVKPGTYMLVVRKEGYDSIADKLTIPPDERPYELYKSMRTLEREVVFNFTSDYESGVVTADEVTFSGKLLRSGESVKPNVFRVVIQKKGYDPKIDPTVVVPPSSAPYILQAQLISTPRRVQHNLTSNYPKGKVTPEKITLEGKDALTQEAFKPGKYTLYIQNNGYEPIGKEIVIPPDIVPYVISEVLQPKMREVVADISQDIPPEDPNTTYTLNLRQDGSEKDLKYQSGLKVVPQSYKMNISMVGYENQLDNLSIFPSDDPYLINRRLTAAPRLVLTKISAEFPAGVTIVPEEISLDNKQVVKDFKILPGPHNLVITKPGYLAVRKDVFIAASDKPYIIEEKLETLKRLVQFDIRDAQERGKRLIPDEAFMDKDRVDTSRSYNLKPGVYKLVIRLRGYAPFEGEETIDVGTEPYTITKYLEPTLRPIRYSITSDFDNKEVVPSLFTIGKTTIDKQDIPFKPGNYTMVIQKPGYEAILRELNIGPSKEPFEIREVMISKPRKLLYKMTSDFPPNQEIKPDKVILGVITVSEGDPIKPGFYTVLIEKKGYNRKAEKITIEPAEEPYTLKQLLQCTPRLVTYEIKGDFDPNVPLTPDTITLNDKKVDGETTFLPGNYNLKIAKLGYADKAYAIVIPPDETPYNINEFLNTIPRKIEFKITSDFPPDEPLEPDVIAFNNKEYEDQPIKPGRYELLLQSPGFEVYKNNIAIEPGMEPYTIEVVMISKPVTIKQSITFDVPPSEEAGKGYKIVVAPKSDPSKETELKDGDKLKPNYYNLKITKDAYEDLEETLRLFPNERPYTVEKKLIAKLVTVLLNITHDITPPPGLELYKVTIMGSDRIPRNISHNKLIKPGSYELKITQPGYKFGTNKSIDIVPSIHPFEIRERLVAIPRSINFKMEDPVTFELVRPHEIYVNGERATFEKTYDPGTEVDVVAKFLKYQTVRTKVKIIPGEGPLTAQITLKKLKMYEFQLKSDSLEIDDIPYMFKFYADDTVIEEHLINKDKAPGRCYYSVWVAEDAKNLKVFAGYLYSQCLFENLYRLQMPSLINGQRLVEHLEKVTSMDPQRRRKALDVIEFLLKQKSKSMKDLAPQEIDELVKYVETWRFDLPEDNIRKNEVIQGLDKLRK